jgi:hypothetical protein
MASAGRHSKHTPEREKAILDALRDGNTRQAACRYGSISDDTFANWLRRSSEFSDAVKEAEAHAERQHVANIVKAASDGTWTASAWWLERRRHQDWGRVDRVEVTLRQQAEKLAADLGLDPAEVIAEAERLVSRTHV